MELQGSETTEERVGDRFIILSPDDRVWSWMNGVPALTLSVRDMRVVRRREDGKILGIRWMTDRDGFICHTIEDKDEYCKTVPPEKMG